MLEVNQIDSFYGDLQILTDLSIRVDEGEVIAIFGPNGHGKSTLLKAISGLHPPKKGSVVLRGQDITKFPAHLIVELGIAYIPEERHLFPEMSVLENLNMGAYNKHARQDRQKNLEFVFDVLPKLAQRKDQFCSTLSGGESRMVAIARGLMSNASLLMIDEPSIGLSPAMKMAVFEAIQTINTQKRMTIIIVEQEIHHALNMANRVYLLKKGQITLEKLKQDISIEEIEKLYF
jgi:branched-chain amino acid transport system ATP-binding protein